MRKNRRSRGCKGWERDRRALTKKEIEIILEQLRAIPHVTVIEDPRDREPNKPRGRKPKAK